MKETKKVFITKDDDDDTEYKGKLKRLFRSKKAAIFVGRAIKHFKKNDEITIEPVTITDNPTESSSNDAEARFSTALRGGYVSASIPGGGLDFGYRVGESGWLLLQAWAGLSSQPISASDSLETTETTIQYTAAVLSYRLLTAGDYIALSIGAGQRIHSITYTQSVGNSEIEGSLDVAATSVFASLGSQLTFDKAYLFVDWVQAAYPISASATGSSEGKSGFASETTRLAEEASEQAEELANALTLAVAVLGFGFQF